MHIIIVCSKECYTLNFVLLARPNRYFSDIGSPPSQFCFCCCQHATFKRGSHLRRKAETGKAYPSVSTCASVSTGSHLDVYDVISTKAGETMEEKGTIHSFRLRFHGSHKNVRFLPSPLLVSSLV